MTAYNGSSITYDTIGNPTAYYNGWNFTWEHGREMATATNGSTTLSFKYDANGLRTSKTVNGVEHTYYYYGGKLLRETYGSNILDFYYDASGVPYMLEYNGTVYYYVTNAQGDVIQLVNASGTAVAKYEYDPYGATVSATSDSSTVNLTAINPLRYRSYYFDSESGLYYLQSRYYDPNTGRLINADVFISTGQGLLSNNMFAYCLNNPASYYDPSGMATLSVRCDDSTHFLNGYYGSGGGGGGAAYALPAAGELINKVDERVNNKSGAVTRADLLTDGYGFYRGRLVVKLDIMGNAAFSFGVIFTGPNPDDYLLAHEYGHTVHLSQIGVADYAAKVALPSATSFWIYPQNPYYTSQPWEYIAEYFGKTARPSNEYLACADELAIIYWIFTVLS